MRLFSKNITGLRLAEVGINPRLHKDFVEIGDSEIAEKLSITKYGDPANTLLNSKAETVDDKVSILIEKVRSVIIEMVYYTDELPTLKYSDYISKKLGINYTYISKLFSKVKRITIEHFIIAHKIERVKQLLTFNDLTLSEIAWKLHYSSTAHLSAQFKKVTGLTPSLFKKMKFKKVRED